jgi:hypothetical protein
MNAANRWCAACLALILTPILTPALVTAEEARKEPTAQPLRGELPEHLKTFKERGLPPIGDRVTFEDTRALPPKLKGRTVDENFRPEIIPSKRAPVAEMRTKMRAAALGDPRVRKALGERFSLLGSGWLEPPKDKAADTANERYQLIFYSYGRNRAVKVIASGDDINEVVTLKAGVQPAESQEEVELAAAIIRRNPRLRAPLDGLLARGIVTPSKTDNRQLYVTFYKKDRPAAVFQATVDMTSGRVLNPRPISSK